jgi:hypothetical protein
MGTVPIFLDGAAALDTLRQAVRHYDVLIRAAAPEDRVALSRRTTGLTSVFSRSALQEGEERRDPRVHRHLRALRGAGGSRHGAGHRGGYDRCVCGAAARCAGEDGRNVITPASGGAAMRRCASAFPQPLQIASLHRYRRRSASRRCRRTPRLPSLPRQDRAESCGASLPNCSTAT